jgi:hypothetical protein
MYMYMKYFQHFNMLFSIIQEAQDIYNMFYTRITLHRRAYQHKTNNIISEMYVKIISVSAMFIGYLTPVFEF